jgi:hypothetical protein
MKFENIIIICIIIVIVLFIINQQKEEHIKTPKILLNRYKEPVLDAEKNPVYIYDSVEECNKSEIYKFDETDNKNRCSNDCECSRTRICTNANFCHEKNEKIKK